MLKSGKFKLTYEESHVPQGANASQFMLEHNSWFESGRSLLEHICIGTLGAFLRGLLDFVPNLYVEHTERTCRAPPQYKISTAIFGH